MVVVGHIFMSILLHGSLVRTFSTRDLSAVASIQVLVGNCFVYDMSILVVKLGLDDDWGPAM